MKAAELREKNLEELQKILNDLCKDRFSYRMQSGAGQLGQVHLLGEVRKDIARVKTIITEKQTLAATDAPSASEAGEPDS